MEAVPRRPGAATARIRPNWAPPPPPGPTSPLTTSAGGHAGSDDVQLRWLEPGRTQIAADGLGLLRVVDQGRSYHGISAVRAFPGTYEEQFLSLHCCEADGHTAELGLMRNLADWPAETVAAVRQVARAALFPAAHSRSSPDPHAGQRHEFFRAHRKRPGVFRG